MADHNHKKSCRTFKKIIYQLVYDFQRDKVQRQQEYAREIANRNRQTIVQKPQRWDDDYEEEDEIMQKRRLVRTYCNASCLYMYMEEQG